MFLNATFCFVFHSSEKKIQTNKQTKKKINNKKRTTGSVVNCKGGDFEIQWENRTSPATRNDFVVISVNCMVLSTKQLVLCCRAKSFAEHFMPYIFCTDKTHKTEHTVNDKISRNKTHSKTLWNCLFNVVMINWSQVTLKFTMHVESYACATVDHIVASVANEETKRERIRFKNLSHQVSYVKS